jgi:glycosyltransferase involved in cell wall biosynthesis
MAEKPLVSVVIPTYNRAGTIARAIESVMRQSHRPLEIIVVDDGSSDGTLRAIDCNAYPLPLTLISLSRNQGAAAARNHGIAMAQGVYVAFLDSDDEWHPDKITRQLRALATAGPAFGSCYTGIARLGEDGRLCGLSRAIAAGDLRLALFNHNLIGSASGLLVTRALLRAVGGFDRTLASCQDWDLCIRLADRTRFACVPEPLTLLHIAREGRISSNGHARLSGYLQLYRMHLRGPFKSGRVDTAVFRTNLGEIFMQLGRPDYAARQFAAIWRAKPWSVKRMTLLALAWSGIGAVHYFRAAAWLNRVEMRLRLSPIAAASTRVPLAPRGRRP